MPTPAATRQANAAAFAAFRSRGCANAHCRVPADAIAEENYEDIQADHVRDKEANIADVVNAWGTPRFLLELAKCQPLCSFCHGQKSRYERRGLVWPGDTTEYWKEAE